MLSTAHNTQTFTGTMKRNVKSYFGPPASTTPDGFQTASSLSGFFDFLSPS